MSQGLIGEKLGSFRLDEVLGSGAMGVVFRATHETTGRQAAVKIVHGEMAQKGKISERFQREAEILKQFRHPHIVRWLAYGRWKGTDYFAMEFVEGKTLEKVLEERGALPWREVVDLAIQLTDALHYSHEKGVVHRDLKPSNLMITAENKLKLTDFGIAKDLDRTALTAPGRTLGTAAYMAPEQIRGTPAVSHKTDLYGLGVVLYQMLTGQAPFEGSSAVVLMHCHLNESPPRPSAKVQEIPKDLDDVVVALMAKAPADRPWDAAAVGHILTQLRDKTERGEEVAMVWPTPGSAGANPTRAGVGVPEARPKKKRKSGLFATFTSGFTGHVPGTDQGRSVHFSRAVLETVGLIGVLLLIGGSIAYWVWPPSASYLYQQAAPLMDSPRRVDWLIARDEFLEPIERRFPDNPYKDQILKWRDKILIDEADSRSKVLSSPNKTRFSEPNTNSERQYVSFDVLANRAANEGNEVAAMSFWRELAGVLHADDPDERPWYLLAAKRANELQARIEERRKFVLEQLERAATAFQAGRPNEGIAIRGMLNEQYGRYTDLADLLGAPAQRPDSFRPAQPGGEPAAPQATNTRGTEPAQSTASPEPKGVRNP